VAYDHTVSAQSLEGQETKSVKWTATMVTRLPSNQNWPWGGQASLLGSAPCSCAILAGKDGCSHWEQTGSPVRGSPDYAPTPPTSVDFNLEPSIVIKL
jgi:hypothetical protein